MSSKESLFPFYWKKSKYVTKKVQLFPKGKESKLIIMCYIKETLIEYRFCPYPLIHFIHMTADNLKVPAGHISKSYVKYTIDLWKYYSYENK